MNHRLWVCASIAFLVASFSGMTCPLVHAQHEGLPRSTPESQGVDSAGIRAFVEAANQQVDSIHSFMMVRNGKVIAEAWWEPEAPDVPHVLWSLSKSFTSTAVGFAVEEGKLSVDDLVLDHFADQAPANPSKNLKRMRIRDLLTMTAGHQQEVQLRDRNDWVKGFLEHPVPHKPGTHFQYNTPATYMLSALVQKVTGEKVVDYLQPRLFDPLGVKAPQWDESPEGISLGGYGLYLHTEDIAKFGQLYLQRGQWKGKQLLPEDWIDLATAKQVSNGSDPNGDWDQGYGFQFWRCRHGAYRGDGKDGQFCIVIPDQNVVVAMTAKTSDMGGQMSLVWEHLLPAIQEGGLPENPSERQRWTKLIANLKATR